MSFNLFPKGIAFSKRILDLALTILAAPFLIPIGLVVAILVRIFHGSPILFRHERPGYREKAFTLYKFRTMTFSHDEGGELHSDAHRLTAFGRFLRTTSLDEIPELYNVLRGEMSLVGPRPLLMDYLDHYDKKQSRRHETLPGISGWAQINGRNNVSWKDKFNLDVWYVDNWSFWLDIKILLLTVPKVLFREGLNQPGNATSMKFTGNQGEGE
jgi:lipopolysaccharide/colanic/teichoic acid biosynthesis glycosyltransferase